MTGGSGSSGARWALAWALGSAPAVFVLLQSPAGGWGAMLGYHAGCVVAASVAGVQWGRRAAMAEILAWAGATVLLLGAVSQGLPWVPVAFDRAAPRLQEWGMQGWSGALAFTWYVVANPWIEERFWRGCLLGARFQQFSGRRLALWLSILGFVPYHAVVIWLMFGATAWWFNVAVLLGSVSWALMTRWRRSIIPAAVSHQIADMILVLLYLLRTPS